MYVYKNNSGLIAKNKVSKYKTGISLTEKLAFQNSLLYFMPNDTFNCSKNLYSATIPLIFLLIHPPLLFLD